MSKNKIKYNLKNKNPPSRDRRFLCWGGRLSLPTTRDDGWHRSPGQVSNSRWVFRRREFPWYRPEAIKLRKRIDFQTHLCQASMRTSAYSPLYDALPNQVLAVKNFTAFKPLGDIIDVGLDASISDVVGDISQACTVALTFNMEDQLVFHRLVAFHFDMNVAALKRHTARRIFLGQIQFFEGAESNKTHFRLNELL